MGHSDTRTVTVPPRWSVSDPPDRVPGLPLRATPVALGSPAWWCEDAERLDGRRGGLIETDGALVRSVHRETPGSSLLIADDSTWRKGLPETTRTSTGRGWKSYLKAGSRDGARRRSANSQIRRCERDIDLFRPPPATRRAGRSRGAPAPRGADRRRRQVNGRSTLQPAWPTVGSTSRPFAHVTLAQPHRQLGEELTKPDGGRYHRRRR